MQQPLVLFGAFDRHNLGDLLLPHVVSALLPGRQLVYAGLAARDLRPYGGHRVEAIADVAAERDVSGDAAATVLHVGGEVLTCDSWTAAVMLLPPGEAQATIALPERDTPAREAWVRRVIGSAAHAPYAAGGAFFRAAPRTAYLAAGGADLDRAEPALRSEVLARLRAAHVVSVRDDTTLGHLRAAGIASAALLPDPAVMVADLCGARITAAGCAPEPAALRQAFPAGYLAIQCSAEFADDATLDALAAQLRALLRDTGFGSALFRAGAAPWHDSLPTLRALAARLPDAPVRVFESLDVWQICALIAASRAVAASSLHARIVAMAFGVPRVTLRSPAAATRKHAAFIATWDDARDQPGVVDIVQLGAAVRAACAVTPQRLADRARVLVDAFRAGFASVVEAIERRA